MPDAVVLGCTMCTESTTLSAVVRSPTFRMYAHENVTDAPGSRLGNRKLRLMASSADCTLVLLYAVQSTLLQPSLASLFAKPKWLTRQLGWMAPSPIVSCGFVTPCATTRHMSGMEPLARLISPTRYGCATT